MINFRNYFMLGIFLFLVVALVVPVLAIEPFGANYTDESSERAQESSPQGVSAQAGNVTELNINGYTTTQSWQGYFGNVTGTIQLANSANNAMYNWSAASPQGEIYASRNGSVNWGTIQCFNFTANGSYYDDSAQAGNTSLYGMNLTQLEASYNINPDDVDGVNETFNLFGEGTHDRFFTNNLEFEEGECMSTRIYSDSGGGEIDKFEEVLLYDSQSKSVVFASLLEQDAGGFDSATHDFEMLVLEDGHGTDTIVTPYYFYVELE